MDVRKFDEEKLYRKGSNIIRAALKAVDPEILIRRKVKRKKNRLEIGRKIFDLDKIHGIRAAAIGKAAPYMAETLSDILGDFIQEGIFLHRPEDPIRVKSFRGLPAPHPYPDERSRKAAQKIWESAKKTGPDGLFLLCISGGGSAQMSYPPDEISLSEKRNVIESLLRAGAGIQEINIVRKHLSLIKGGRLAEAAYPSPFVNVILSDVAGNDPEIIASGPGWGDSSTFEDARSVLIKYRLWPKLPHSVKKYIQEGIQGKRPESPDTEHPVFHRVSNVIIGDNQTALDAAHAAAERTGFSSSILTSGDRGEARDKAAEYVSVFMEMRNRNKYPFCLIAGGELTVTVRGSGKGGRNQEFVLAFLEKMRSSHPTEKNWAVFSLGTDGIDGPTDAAGARGGPSFIRKAENSSLHPKAFLSRNDSYSFFRKTGGLVITGPTRTNVMDIRLFLSG